MPSGRLKLLRRVGALVEAPSLYPHLTGRENLEITRRLIGGRRERIEEVLRIVGLEEHARRKVRGYSNGMKQRLGLGLALLGEPDLLILDEPTNGLDPAGIREMREFILRLPEEQAITVFLSSHLLSEVEQMATHIGIIQKGRLIFQGTQNDLQSQLADHLALAVDRPTEAENILTRSGWFVRRNGSDRLLVTVNGQSDVAMINSQLTGGGVNVFHVSLERPKLEDIFMSLTGEADR
jgi:ABC-2 type transport system ATP-binding protein